MTDPASVQCCRAGEHKLDATAKRLCARSPLFLLKVAEAGAGSLHLHTQSGRTGNKGVHAKAFTSCLCAARVRFSSLNASLVGLVFFDPLEEPLVVKVSEESRCYAMTRIHYAVT